MSEGIITPDVDEIEGSIKDVKHTAIFWSLAISAINAADRIRRVEIPNDAQNEQKLANATALAFAALGAAMGIGEASLVLLRSSFSVRPRLTVGSPVKRRLFARRRRARAGQPP